MRNVTVGRWTLTVLMGWVMVSMATVLMPMSASGADAWWSGASDNVLTNGLNWDGNVAPTETDALWFGALPAFGSCPPGRKPIVTADTPHYYELVLGANGCSGEMDVESGTLTADIMYVGFNGSGTGKVVQTGGRVVGGIAGASGNITIVMGHQARGEYELNDGVLDVSGNLNPVVGSGSIGVFTQRGGTNNAAGTMVMAWEANGTGTYNLVGGVFNAGGVYVGYNGAGIINIGDSNTNGMFGNSPAMLLGFPSGKGTLRGWGTIPGTVYPIRSTVIADGYGTDRTLTLAGGCSAGVGMPIDGQCAWRAVNHGKLLGESFSVGTGTYYWPAITNTPINSMQLVVSGGSGTLTGALLAIDHGSVSNGLSKAVAVWDFSGVTFATSCELTIRYDEVAAANRGVAESELKVYQHVNGRWTNITVSVNTGNKTIVANAVNPLSQIAVANIPPVGAVMLFR